MYVGGCKIDAAYLGACKLDKIYLGVCEVLSGVQAVPKWQAFVPDPTTGVMTGLIGGVGQPTNARTAPINLINYDELYGQQDALKVGYVGGRLDGGVVYGTDEAGDPLPEMPWAVRFPQFTNISKDCRQFDYGWVKTIALSTDTVDRIDGTQPAVVLADNSASSVLYGYSHSVGVNTNQKYGAAFFIRKNYSDPTTESRWEIKAFAGGEKYIAVRLDEETGVAQLVTNQFTESGFRVESVGNYWMLLLYASGEEAGGTYWRNSINPAYYSPGGIAPAMQSIIVDAMQSGAVESLDHLAALSRAPVYTTSADVIRDKDDIQLNVMNHDDTGGTYYLESSLSGACNILGDFLQFDGTAVHLINASGTSSVDAAPGVHKIGLVWGQGTMRLNVDGVWGTEVSYNGTLLSGAFDIGRDSAWPVYVRNFPAYDYNDESVIDQLMA